MKLFVGLGNPGREYARTRYNAGFMVLDTIAKEENVEFKSRGSYEYAEISVSGNKFWLLKPQTYMNLSGDAVTQFLKYHELPPEEICVFFDDVSLATGMIRVRTEGSDGGHKGIRDIILKLNTDLIPRVRIGVGPKPGPIPLERFVLMDFIEEERDHLRSSVMMACKAYRMMKDGAPFKDLMNEFNRKNKTDDRLGEDDSAR